MTLDMGFETVDKIAGSLPKDLQFMVFQGLFTKTATILKNTCPTQLWNKSRPTL